MLDLFNQGCFPKSKMKDITEIAEGVFGVQTKVKLGAGAWLPLRMTVLVDHGELTLVSPIAIDDELATKLAELGPVRTLLAPNLLHHNHVAAAKERYPDAQVLAAPGLAEKRADIEFDGTLATGPLSDELEAILIEGAPKLSEVVFLHRPSRTLVVTDLVFNIEDASGMSWLVLSVVSRALGRVEQSRLCHWLTKDRAAAGVERRVGPRAPVRPRDPGAWRGHHRGRPGAAERGALVDARRVSTP